MIIGRKNEIDILNTTMQDDASHFVAVYGRRRIGKTFLVREAFNYRFDYVNNNPGKKDTGFSQK